MSRERDERNSIADLVSSRAANTQHHTTDQKNVDVSRYIPLNRRAIFHLLLLPRRLTHNLHLIYSRSDAAAVVDGGAPPLLLMLLDDAAAALILALVGDGDGCASTLTVSRASSEHWFSILYIVIGY